MNVDCVLFVRTRTPVDPLVLVRAICKDAAAARDRSMWRSRFVNKLTPITFTGKATEKGLEDVARKVLAEHFQLAESATETGDGEGNACSVSTHSEERGTPSNINPSFIMSHMIIFPLKESILWLVKLC